jgi:acetolactate synthase-1/2/3 large subunit
MPRMTGGEAIVDGLLRHGIDTVFGLPGVQTYGLFDAFARASNRLRLINARHEQTTAYMALGYACATGRPAAYAVVPGPGVLNTTAALATAWGVNAPVLCLTGQVPSAMIGRGRGQLHELPDQLATLRSL